MKYTILLALILPLQLMAQECSLRQEIDPFSQKPRLTTGFMKIGGGKFSLSGEANAAEIDIMINFLDKDKPVCFNETTTTAVYFDSTRSRSNFRNTGATNCEGILHITFRNSATVPSGLTRLASSRIASFRITPAPDQKPIEVILTDPEKEQLKKMLTCLAAEAKTMLPK